MKNIGQLQRIYKKKNSKEESLKLEVAKAPV
jgi:hypothetical protein